MYHGQNPYTVLPVEPLANPLSRLHLALAGGIRQHLCRVPRSRQSKISQRMDPRFPADNMACIWLPHGLNGWTPTKVPPLDHRKPRSLQNRKRLRGGRVPKPDSEDTDVMTAYCMGV